MFREFRGIDLRFFSVLIGFLFILFFLILRFSDDLDGLFVSNKNKINVYCPVCKRRLYSIGYEDHKFAALDTMSSYPGIPRFKQWKGFVCPLDGAPLNGWEYWFLSRGYKNPEFRYPAVTVYTKNSNGEFTFFPDDVDKLIHDK